MSVLDDRPLDLSPTRAEQIEQWRTLRDGVLTPRDAAAVDRQLSRGKLLARERIELLLDAGSFQELMMMDHTACVPQLRGKEAYGDGIVAGGGTIDGRRAFVFSQDATVVGGSLGEIGGAKVQRIVDLAVRTRAPVIGILDGGGARIQEGVSSLNAFGGIFLRNSRASGVIPQISLIMGVATGGAVYSPALTDFVFMVEPTAVLAITGPKVIKEVTGEDVTLDELGGAAVHGVRTGVVHFVTPDDRTCLDGVRRLLSFLPQSFRQLPPFTAPRPPPSFTGRDPLDELPPADGRTYDVREIVRAVVDDGDVLEYGADWARNVVCGFTRIGGQALGVVANQPAAGDGRLDSDGCEKAARFVRTCDAYNLPLVTLVDCPGLAHVPPPEQGRFMRAVAKLVHAVAEATVPKVTLVVGQAHPDAILAIGPTRAASDLRLAWPTADFRTTGNTLADCAKAGIVDRIVEPRETRVALLQALAMLGSAEHDPIPRKHENVPL